MTSCANGIEKIGIAAAKCQRINTRITIGPIRFTDP